jgi:hypothetical protein
MFQSATNYPGGNMPYIRGRYHINPVAGQALEAAREAEAALQALEHAGKSGREDGDDGSDGGGTNDGGEDSAGNGSGAGRSVPGPIHRVEIESAELVPSHSGRAQKGFVARVHRHVQSGSKSGTAFAGRIQSTTPEYAPQSTAETHVFTDHRDLTNFLSGEFAKECGN